jgi:hypothetical protein
MTSQLNATWADVRPLLHAFYETRRPLQCSQGPAIGPCLEIRDVSPHPLIQLQWKCLLTYLPTHCSRVLLEMLTVLQPVKKFPALYGTRKFVTVFTNARHLSLSWPSSFQSITQHSPSWRFVLILSSHLRLGLPSGLFPSGFPIKTQCKYILI